MTNDPVNHPAHYTQGEVECIDAIESALGRRGYEDYCTGAAIKYLWRWRHKGGKQDLEKAAWYIDRIIQSLEKVGDKLFVPTSLEAAVAAAVPGKGGIKLPCWVNSSAFRNKETEQEDD